MANPLGIPAPLWQPRDKRILGKREAYDKYRQLGHFSPFGAPPSSQYRANASRANESRSPLVRQNTAARIVFSGRNPLHPALLASGSLNPKYTTR
jgi:hypothetical protein